MHPRAFWPTATRNTPDPAGGGSPPVVPSTPPVDPKQAVAPPAAPAPVVPAAATAPPGTVPAEPPAPSGPKPDWRDARIAELTAKYNELKRAAPSAPTPAPPATTGPTEAEISARVSVEAARIAQATAWNEACNAVASAGSKKFPDFQARIAAVQSVVNSQDETEVAQYSEVLSAAIETGKAPELLHQLGGTPGEVTRLMRLSPVKRAMEIATMAAKLEGGSPEPSGAPKPITPIGSSGVHYDGIKADDPNNGTKLPIGEWMKQREKQAEERRIQ